MSEAMAVLEQAIDPGPFLLGDTMSLADVYIAMMLIWYRGTIMPPRLTALKDSVRRNSTIAPIWRRHFGD